MLLILLLASAAGLVAMGVVGMGSAIRDAQERARDEVVRAQRVRVEALGRSCARPEFFARCRRGERFALRGGDAKLLDWPKAVLSPTHGAYFASSRALAAQKLEFEKGDVAGARKLLLTAEAADGIPATTRASLALRRAWLERRAELRDAQSLAVDVVAGLAYADAEIASALWFVATHADATQENATQKETSAASGALLEGLAQRLPSVSDEALAALEDAARARGERGEALRRNVESARHMRAARAELERRSAWIASLRPPAAALTDGDYVVVLEPATGGGANGAILRFERFVEALCAVEPGLSPGDIVREEGADSSQVARIWPGIGLRVDAAPELAFWSRPRIQALVLGALALLFCVLLWIYLRSVRAERAALALRSDFLRSVSHELRTPLSSIRMLAETLESQRVTKPEKRSEYHRLMAGEAARLGALVENVLDLGRIERGERRYVLEPMRLDAVVTEALELFAPLASRASLELRRALRATLVLGERDALQQTVLNLLDNAVKYAASGAFVSVEIERDGAFVCLRVLDDGPGITPSERARIFGRFERGAQQSDGAIPGAGIGLSIARSIAEAHGGSLCVVDTEKGACFELRLPRALPEDDALIDADSLLHDEGSREERDESTEARGVRANGQR